MQFNSLQGLYAQLTVGFICHLSICIVLDLAVAVAVCKAYVLKILGGLSPLYIYIYISSVALFKASEID